MSEQSQSRKSMSCLVKAVILILALLGLGFCLWGAITVGALLEHPVILPDGTNYQGMALLLTAVWFIPAALFFVAALIIWFVARRRTVRP